MLRDSGAACGDDRGARNLRLVAAVDAAGLGGGFQLVVRDRAVRDDDFAALQSVEADLNEVSAVLAALGIRGRRGGGLWFRIRFGSGSDRDHGGEREDDW